MLNVPTEPIRHISAIPINCSGCVDKEITKSWRFDGIDANFCDECMLFIRHIRANPGANREPRECRTCGETFMELVSRPRVYHCPNCREDRRAERSSILDLFARSCETA